MPAYGLRRAEVSVLYETKVIAVEAERAPRKFSLLTVGGERLRVLSVREVRPGRFSLKVAPGGRLGSGRNDERIPRRTRGLF
jgi:hypothetical protein